MEYRHGLLFICIIICLFSIASVCASDIDKTNYNQSDDFEIENQTISIEDKEILSALNDDLDNDIAQIEEEPVLNKENSQITIETEPIYVGETAKINITVKNATGYVVVSVDDQTFNKTLLDNQVKLDVSGLTYGSHNVAVFYSGDANYLSDFKLETLQVNKLQTEIADISVDEAFYGQDVYIEATVPDGVEGDIIIRLNDAYQTNITERIYDGRALFKVSGLAVGNYTLSAVYVGNDYYAASDAKLAGFEVKKADPNLNFVSFEGTVHDEATIMIIINEEINDEVVNISVDGVRYDNCHIDYGAISLTTDVLDEIKVYEIIAEYGGNGNFEGSRIVYYGTLKKVTTYGINIIAGNITVNDDEIITVEVPNHVDDVVIWVNGQSYRNCSFAGNNATFIVTGLAEGIYVVTATVNDTEFDHRNFTKIFTVSKMDPSITAILVNETPVCVGDTVRMTVSVPRDVAGNVTIMVNGRQFAQKPVDGNATFSIDDFVVGTNSIPVIYYGDEKYRANVFSLNFTVYKQQSFVNVSAQDISINDTEQIIFALPGDASGNITVFVNDERYVIAVSGGKGILTLSKLHKGDYYVNATYNGDGKYLPSQNRTEMFRVIINSNQMDVIDEMNNTLSIYLNDNATGDVTVEIEGKFYYGTVINGTGKVLLVNATIGTHHAHVVYSDSVSHDELEAVVDVHIPKYAASLDVNSSIAKVGDLAYINVTVPSSATGNVTIEIEGKSYTKAIDGGIAKFELTLLSAGKATLSVRYGGDDTYMENSTSAILYVFKKESDIALDVKDIYVGDVAQINITGPEDISGTVIVSLNGIDYAAILSNGAGSVNVSDLQSGEHEIVAYYQENARYLASVRTQNVTVFKKESKITIDVKNINVGEIAHIGMTGPEDISGTVIVSVNGRDYTTTFSNGVGSVDVADLQSGEHDIVANYQENAKYLASSDTQKVTVSKIQTALLSSDVVCEYNGGKYLVATLRDIYGSPISGAGLSVNINGVKYLTTDANGQIKLSLMNIAPNSYNVAIDFAGNAKYVKSTANVKVTIKKATPKLSAAKKTFKRKVKVKKYTVTLKTNRNAALKGVSVVLKIKNKKYAAKTNAAGKAIFKIKKLTKKGTFKATIKFKGNKYYKAVTKKVKIKIK